MKIDKALSYLLLACVAVAVAGCARAPRDASGLAVTETVVIRAPFQTTWEATRDALRSQDFDIHTRDKRGRFVAYSDVGRDILVVPRRKEYTITLRPESAGATRVTVQTLRQVYGSTLLTYPDWHNRQTEDNTRAVALLQSIDALATGASTIPATPVETPAEDGNLS